MHRQLHFCLLMLPGWHKWLIVIVWLLRILASRHCVQDGSQQADA